MNRYCQWVTNKNLQEYHDLEHGKLIVNNKQLFERLTLEIMQPGLSFNVVLLKRKALKEAFCNYDIEQLINYGEEDIQKLIDNHTIIRNEKKIRAIINNAKVVYQIIKKQLLIDYFVDLLDYRLLSEQMINQVVKKLKQDGFKFIGPSVVRSFLASIGLLNAHDSLCQDNQELVEKEIFVQTRFGVLNIHYQNFKIISSKFDYKQNTPSIINDGFAYVITRQLLLYEHYQLSQFKLCFAQKLTPFQSQVYDVVINSKFGDYFTYKEVAHQINSNGYRAVGAALKKNKIAFFIPTYRVGNKDKIGGFNNNEELKQKILDFEHEYTK